MLSATFTPINTFTFLPMRLVLVVCLFAVVSCNDSADSNAKYMEATDCTGSSPTYTAHVAPILNARCATSGCHTAISPSHGLNLQGYQIVKSTFDQHKLLCSINHGSECNAMPQGAGKLSESDILTITCWAKNGFPH